MIPDTPDFNHALASLVVGELPQITHAEVAIACEALDLGNEKKVLDRLPRIAIAYNRETSLALDSLLRCIEKQLCRLQHTLFDSTWRRKRLIATKLLGLAVACSTKTEEIRSNLECILSSICDCTLDMFAIFHIRIRDDSEYCFGDFTFGELNLRRLEQACVQAGSDYFDRYGKSFSKCLAITRRTNHIRIIDFKGSPLHSKKYEQQQLVLWHRLLDEYHGDIADEFWERFRIDIDSQQALMTALGVGGVSSSLIFQVETLSSTVAVFSRDTKDRGWVLPNKTRHQISRRNPCNMASTRDNTSNQLRLSDFGVNGLDNSIQLYSGYIAAAIDYEQSGQLEEALLHSIFALDLLLGGKSDEPLTAILAERTGFLCFQSMDLTLKDATKFVRETYDLRSGYAHRGEKGSLDKLVSGLTLADRYAQIKTICRVVLLAACWARRQDWCKERDNWMARIDLLRARSRTGDSVDTELECLGLNRIEKTKQYLSGFQIDWPETEFVSEKGL